MLKWYGIIGFFLLGFGILIPLLNIEPFVVWYFPILWHGYILFLDSINFKISGKSLLTNRPREFLLMLLPYWFVFEFFNLFVKNWHFVNFPLIPLVLACTILPAYFETNDIISYLFRKKINYKVKFRLSTKILYMILALGLILSLMTLSYPKQFFWSFWFGLFFVFDTLNYIRGQSSFISLFVKNEFKTIITFSISGFLIGVLFEIFNTVSTTGWVYTIPVYLGPNLLGLPAFAYLGYIVLAFDLFALYNFTKSIFLK